MERSAPASAAGAPGAQKNFAVTLVHGPAWDATRGIREQDLWREHAAFMDELVSDGFLLLGGPVGAGDHTLHAVEASDEETVRARFARDPWAESDHLRMGTIERWTLWLDFRFRPV